MSHQVILGRRPPHGPLLVAEESSVDVNIVWTPHHDLSPAQERRKIDKANEKIAALVSFLEEPSGSEE